MDYRWAEWDLGHASILMVLAAVTFIIGTTALAHRRRWTSAIFYTVTIVASTLAAFVIMRSVP
jgi:hypothetical protein